MIASEQSKGRALVLAQSAVAASVTGTLTDTTLATIAIPANMLGLNGALRITSRWSCTGSTNLKNFRTKFGGTTFNSAGTVTASAINFRSMCTIQNRNSVASQIGDGDGFGLGAATTNLTGTVDTTAAQNVTLTAQLANVGETVTLESYIVELLLP